MDGTKVNYVAWDAGEPNFANDDENCVTMYSSSGRKDESLICSSYAKESFVTFLGYREHF